MRTVNIIETRLFSTLVSGWSFILTVGLCLGLSLGIWGDYSSAEPPTDAKHPAIMPGTIYRATALLKINVSALDGYKSTVIGFSSTTSLKNFAGEEYPLFCNLQKNLLVSSYVLKAALAVPECAALPTVKQQESPVPWLKRRLKVALIEDEAVLELSLVSEDAKEAEALVAAVADAYLTKIVGEDFERHKSRLKHLDQTRGETEGDLRRTRTELKALFESLGTRDKGILPWQERIAYEQLSLAGQELVSLRKDGYRLKAELESQRAMLKSSLLDKLSEGTRNEKKTLIELEIERIAVVLQVTESQEKAAEQRADEARKETRRIAEAKEDADALHARVQQLNNAMKDSGEEAFDLQLKVRLGPYVTLLQKATAKPVGK